MEKHAQLSWTITKMCTVLPYFIALLQRAKKIVWKISGLQKYGELSDLFCAINSNFTVFQISWTLQPKLSVAVVEIL
jgi:hypothetical protein